MKGRFILNKDFYDVPYRDREFYERLDYRNHYANVFVNNLVREFYNEWYDISDIVWWFRINPCERKYELMAEFNYTPHIKPHLTDCLEYMIDNLQAA